MLNPKGHISIGRPSGDASCDYISIEIGDELSGIEFVEARVKYAEFAKLMTGLYVDCEIITRGLHLVGMIQEHKTVEVFMPDGEYHTQEERAKAAIEPHEVDGWDGSFRDALNHHNRVKDKRVDNGGWYRVGFVRHVEPTD